MRVPPLATRHPRIALVVTVAVLGAVVVVVRRALDHRPVHAYAALPAPGAPLPAFRLPTLTGDTLSSSALLGAPSVLALWSLECGVSRLALQAIGQLHDDYAVRGAHVVILADDGDVAALRRVLDSAGVRVPVAYADGHLRRLFDWSRSAPERASFRVRFALPGFLVTDAAGRVTYRGVGITLDEYRGRDVKLGSVRVALDRVLEPHQLSEP